MLCERDGSPILLPKLRYAHPGPLTFNLFMTLTVVLAEYWTCFVGNPHTDALV
jgi:hypothetical protein